MLNYAYIVEAGRLAKALAVNGLCLSIGYLHSDKNVQAHEFARSDFCQSGYNVHRLSREVTQLLLHKTSLPRSEIEEAAEWMARTIARCAGLVARAKIGNASRDKGEDGAERE
jgi:hypothetical protein